MAKHSTQNEMKTDDDIIDDEPQFMNLYQPSIPPPWGNALDEIDEKRSRQTVQMDYTIIMDDENADNFANTTHVGCKSRVDYAFNEYKREHQLKTADEGTVYNDMNVLLNVTITTIILLASGHYDIPWEYYMYAENYLKAVKDKCGNSPKNIGNLLRHIQYLKKEHKINWGEEFIIDPPSGLQITKFPISKKQSKIPVRSLKSPSKIQYSVPLNESGNKNQTEIVDKTTTNP